MGPFSRIPRVVRRSGFKSLQCSTTLIRVENISGIKCLDRRVSVAPMMDWTDRHCRYFLRQFSPRVLLYTEMIVAQAILKGDRPYLLEFDPAEHPVALQLGGAEPGPLAEAAAIGAAFGYDEINLNVGCPSDRVQQATFGACLMARPRLVADCVRAMRAAVDGPGHGEVPDRHRRSRRLGVPARLRRRDRGGRLPHRHRPRAQGDPEGTDAEAESRSPAARLCARLAGEARVPGAHRDRQRRLAHGAAGGRAARSRRTA